MTPSLRDCLVAGYVALSGCTSMPAAQAEPAVLDDRSAQGREELARLVAEALNRPSVLLADDTLLHEDVFIVERRPRRDANGVLLNGRETEAPQHFRLIKQGEDCYVVHEESKRQWHLKQACTAFRTQP